MKQYHFLAMISRMKYINRWSLMRNTRPETLAEHSLDVALIAHMLGCLRNHRFGGTVDVSRLTLLALYHDAAEILTGDLPTPVKYLNDTIKAAYREAEDAAVARMMQLLPEDLEEEFLPLFKKSPEDAQLWPLVKAADKLSALVKCIEERRAGNNEFLEAERSIQEIIIAMDIPEAMVFLNEFLPGYALTLDELEKQP